MKLFVHLVSFLSLLTATASTATAINAQDSSLAVEDMPVDPPRLSIIIYENTYDDKNLETNSVSHSQADAFRIGGLFAAANFNPLILVNPTAAVIDAEVNNLLERDILYLNNQGFRPIVLIYFAGHGFSTKGYDYIAPRDFKKGDSQRTGVPIESLVRTLATRADVLVFFDACRTDLSDKSKFVGKPIDDPSGRGAYDPSPTQAPAPPPGDEKWTLSFAAEKHSATLSSAVGTGKQSPYSFALTRDLQDFDVQLLTALSHVRNDVLRETDRRQIPDLDYQGAAGGNFFLRASPRELQAAKERWQQAKNTNDPDIVQRYIDDNGSSQYVTAARKWLEIYHEKVMRKCHSTDLPGSCRKRSGERSDHSDRADLNLDHRGEGISV